MIVIAKKIGWVKPEPHHTFYWVQIVRSAVIIATTVADWWPGRDGEAVLLLATATIERHRKPVHMPLKIMVSVRTTQPEVVSISPSQSRGLKPPKEKEIWYVRIDWSVTE